MAGPGQPKMQQLMKQAQQPLAGGLGGLGLPGT